MRSLIAVKDYSSAISNSGYILKEDEDNLEALHLRGNAYYYLADHDIAIRCVLITTLLLRKDLEVLSMFFPSHVFLS